MDAETVLERTGDAGGAELSESTPGFLAPPSTIPVSATFVMMVACSPGGLAYMAVSVCLEIAG
ncbi:MULTISPECIES: hypothetical protein [unclassified Streptomyces]|uniref:hypothetical protein n=1 Tax=unclassified Streptomyces TaxID=2593676 RepID=UPI001905A580|nr:hypothetical protein [Streptomyces sp. HSG2]